MRAIRRRIRAVEMEASQGVDSCGSPIRRCSPARRWPRVQRLSSSRRTSEIGRVDRQEIHEPRASVPRPHPGRQHRPDEGGRQVRVPAWIQILDVRDVVDSSGDHACDRRPGPHDPYPGPHDRDDQQARAHRALPRSGAGSSADARRDRREDGYAGREGPQGAQDRQRAHQPGDADRRGARFLAGRFHRR